MAELINNLLFASELGKRPQVAKLAEQHNSGAASFVMENLDGWADQCSFVVYEVDTDGNPILGSETDWIGVRSGRNIQYAIKTSGIDRDYPASRTYAVATETAGARNKLIESLLRILDTDGSLKQDIIDGLNIKDNTITGNKLSGRTITGDKLSLKSVGSAELKDGAVKANNIDFTISTNNGWTKIPISKDIAIYTIDQKTPRRTYSGGAWGYVESSDFPFPQGLTRVYGGAISGFSGDSAISVNLKINNNKTISGTWRNNYGGQATTEFWWSAVVISSN